jgi:DNA-directed RNA polymerase specialized sigma24 family protein
MPQLNETLTAYRAGRATRRQIRDACVLFIYCHPVLQRTFSQDDLHDFVIDLMPRIDRLIDRFDLGTRPLEAYLVRMARFHVRTFGKRRREKARAERMVVDQSKLDVVQPGPRNADFPIRILNWPWRPADRMRVLYLALRSAPDLTLAQMKALSDFSGISLETLFGWADELRSKTLPRRDRKAQERSKLERSFARLVRQNYDEECRNDSGRTSKLRALVAEQRRRYLAYDSSCSHKAIAEVTGVSKGTIDSAIYHIKRRIADYEERENLESVSERA